MILDSSGRPIKSARRPGSAAGGMAWAFDAAKRSGYRGMFWFPSLDPADQMPEWTREEIAKKINYLYNRIGAVRAVIDGLALDEVDTGLWPKPATKSEAFNAAVKAAWAQQCGFHRSFSANGADNFYSAQYLIRREIRLRGDVFAEKLRAGDGAACPQLHFLPGYQCGNSRPDNDPAWRDGRLDNALGRPVKYRFIASPDRTQYRDVLAADCIHFHDPFLVGQRRGISALAPVARKLFSLDDIERAETSGVLLRSRIAYAIERNDDGGDDGPTLLPGATDAQEITNADGTKTIIQTIVADSEGTEVEVVDTTNRKVKVIESAKSSESGSWIDRLLADIAHCTLYPAEYIFALAGLGQGTLVRMTQNKVQRVINTIRDFQIIQQLLEEWWPFWLWQNIARGTFAGVRGGIPDQWWPYIVVRPRDLTVDVGREGRLYDERVGAGKMPVGLYVGMMYGEDEEDFDEQIVRDHVRRKKLVARIAAEEGLDLDANEIFRPPAGTNQPAADPPTDDDPDDAAARPPNGRNGKTANVRGRY